MYTKMITVFSTLLFSGLMAHAMSPMGTWHSDHFMFSDSTGATADAGEGTFKFQQDDDILSGDLLGDIKLTIKGSELWYNDKLVGTISAQYIVVEHLIMGKYNDDYSFSLTLNAENEAQFIDRLVYGDEPDYYDSLTATLARQSSMSVSNKLNSRIRIK